MDELWIQLTAKAGIDLTPEREALLNRYLDLLLAANQVMNLTRITDPAAARVLHVGDSMTLLPHLPKGPHRLADVGSGGGVPGIVLAILRPDCKITLIEATLKKADFLKSTASELGLKNVIIAPVRAEDAGRGNLREYFEVAVARAVGKLPQLAEWMLPLVRRGGLMLAMKGPKVKEEIPEARATIRRYGGGKLIEIPATLPGAEGHVIVLIPKERTLPPIKSRSRRGYN
jgi:16S rRNA (guanine527-N7)-methyltransferase